MGLGSGIRKKPIPDPGSRIQGSKSHRIPDLDPQHWLRECTTEYTHRAATADFWRTSHHDEKISPGWWGEGGGRVYAHPLSLYYHHVQSCRADKLPLFHLYLYVLCGVYNHVQQ